MTVCRKQLIPVDKDIIALVSIDRADVANAFNKEVMQELTSIFLELSKEPNVRCVMLKGEGKHFSAGADLNWMRDSAKLNFEENILDSGLLNKMFKAYTDLPMPTLALVKGAAYGGAVGLIAASDIVIADSTAKFCLSETKLGLLPAVIYPLLMRRVAAGPLKRWALTARVLDAQTAQDIHLVDVIADDLEGSAVEEVQLILSAAPRAQTKVKALHESVRNREGEIEELCIRAIAEARTGIEGQHGLQSFFNKKSPDWSRQLGDQLVGKI